MSATKKRSGLSQLTQQEKKVLKVLVKGKTNKEIAAILDISPSTVKKHLENILRKLHLRNRVGAAVYAVRMEDCPGECRATKMAA